MFHNISYFLLYFNFFFFDRNVYQCVWIDIWMHGTLYQRHISQDYSGSTVKEEAFNINLLRDNNSTQTNIANLKEVYLLQLEIKFR